MADKVIGSNPHIERPFGWVTFHVTPEALTSVTDVTVTTLPAGTVILDAKVVTIVETSNVGTCRVDIEVGATGVGDTVLVAGATDQLSTTGEVECLDGAVLDATLTTINAVSLGGADLVVNAEITYSGTETIPPTIGVMILCGRNDIS